MDQDDVKKILCNRKAEAASRSVEAIRSSPEFKALPQKKRREFLRRCIAADEAYIAECEAAIEDLLS